MAGLIRVKTIADGVALVNRLAPEHCEVMTRNAAQGREANPHSRGDFSWAVFAHRSGRLRGGASHTLPTGGAGASFAGLTVDQFQRRTSVVEYTAASLKSSLKTIATLPPWKDSTPMPIRLRFGLKRKSDASTCSESRQTYPAVGEETSCLRAGEQPKIKGLIKLNTNENPYPPSPKVLEAMRAATDGRLRLYPNPTADTLREKLARYHRAVRRTSSWATARMNCSRSGRACLCGTGWQRQKNDLAAAPCSISRRAIRSIPCWPTFTARRRTAVPLATRFQFAVAQGIEASARWDFNAALTFVTTPNAPERAAAMPQRSSTELCRAQRGVVVLDEAYVDFADENAMQLALKHSPRACGAHLFQGLLALLSTRRLFRRPPGAHRRAPQDSRQLQRQWLGQIAALATLDDLAYYRAEFPAHYHRRETVSRRNCESSASSSCPARPISSLREAPPLAKHGWKYCGEEKSWFAGSTARK